LLLSLQDYFFNKNIMSSSISERSKTFLEHVTFWLFMFLFVFDYHFRENNWAQAIGATLLEVLTYAIIIYLNLGVLIPIFLKKGRPFWYVLSLAVVVMGYIFLMREMGWEKEFYEIGGWRNVFSMVLNTSLFMLISCLYWYFKQWQIERERLFILKNEKLEAEINFLRAQISPHFVFNTLNNIYALALKKHDNAAPMVAKLSALLRHILYESNQAEVLLKKELDTLKQYIELNLLRNPRSQNVDFYVEGYTEGWRIAPMLLINFVENAFKHSDLNHDEKAWIKIIVMISEIGELHFSLGNSVSPTTFQTEPGGIGLQNVRHQLELSYPGNYLLSIQNEGDIFEIQLKLKLKKG
jgi:sensor histidine kinase YesM